MKHLFYTLFIFLFCAATSVTAQTVSQVRSQSTDPTYTPTGAVTSPPLCYNRTTHHLWGYAGGYWYDLTSTPYIDLDPSPTNEKIVSFSVVAGVLRINENGIFYNVPINDIIAAVNISSASPTITVTNTAGVISITSADPDESVTNELQDLNLAGQTLSISSGNNVALPVVGVTAGVGISTSTVAGVTTVTNTSPDQTVILNGGGATTVTGTYPNFTVTTPLSLDNDPTNECNTSITVNSGNLEITDPCSTQSVAVTNIAPVQAIAAGTGISTSVAGGTVTITNTDPDQTVTVTGAGINTVTGTYPNFTVTATEVDGSITNECNTAFFVTVDSLKITDNCGTLSVPLSAFGTPTLADNGLSMAGDTVHLGGTLHKNTTVTQDGYEMIFTDTHPSGDVSQIYQGDNFLGAGLSVVGQSYVTPAGANSYVYTGGVENALGVENGGTYTKIIQNSASPIVTEIVTQDATQNSFRVYENTLQSTAYPQTRDDSGTTPPINFLYTDASGVVQSAPTALIAPDLCAQIQALPTATPAPTDKIVYFGGGVVPPGFVGFDFDNAIDFVCAGSDPTLMGLWDMQFSGGNAPAPVVIPLTNSAAINNYINTVVIPAYNLVNSPPLAVGDIVWQYNVGSNTVTVWFSPSVTLYPTNFVIGDLISSCDNPVPTIPTTQPATGGCFLGDAPAGGVQDTSFWRLTGNAGTDGGTTNFVGTTDAQDLVLKTNNVEIARFGQQGNATIGSDLTAIDPSYTLPIATGVGAIAMQAGQATGEFSKAWGIGSIVSGYLSNAWGLNNLITGDQCTAFGIYDTLTNQWGTAWGIFNNVSGAGGTAWGSQNKSIGDFSTTWGIRNISSAEKATAWGATNVAGGDNSTSWGNNNIANGRNSTSFGHFTTSPSYAETTIGSATTLYTPIDAIGYNATDRLFTIGNGATLAARNNALTIWKDGRSMWNGDVAKQNTWIGVNGTNAQNFINVTTPTGSLAAISTEHTPSGNYAVLGSNAGNSGLVINDSKQFAFTTTAGTTSTQLGATTTIANYSNTGVVIGGGTAATSTLDVVGSFSLPVLIVNATTTITSTNCSIECNNGATNITLTLPAPTTCRGRIYMVHRNAGSTGTVTINPGGGQIQALAGTLGATTTISALGSYGQHVWFQSDGTNWLRIN